MRAIACLPTACTLTSPRAWRRRRSSTFELAGCDEQGYHFAAPPAADFERLMRDNSRRSVTDDDAARTHSKLVRPQVTPTDDSSLALSGYIRNPGTAAQQFLLHVLPIPTPAMAFSSRKQRRA